MKFFLPHAKNKEQAEKNYEAIKRFAKDTLGWNVKDRRIFRIKYTHDGKNHYAEVGKTEQIEGEEVIAILESGYSDTIVYLICTPNRGVVRGMPILVGENEAYSVVDFDE